ncbi:AraC family transcriptional regulator [Pseudoteredinibacter isoporae]|uniref:AraC-like DNA-binding protein n=1 Tax=Pseudoteredinibacter isoporae TaxID=570281 RepID=A0A7X0JS35_9GAMM|nr:AraC family transcriptional regulator [Pseudoteredinibacter isoporae]MBB6521255.1 AraC-like DNA-binding protein [Pseudoteredinibacter isoporae]NHO86813.1 AraC family transcriptional regulator [Pseudoteredinibacter isoporae]NIB24735.1 AraC family transcriptional regulator [Pseudoteredinibacter isoporae]
MSYSVRIGSLDGYREAVTRLGGNPSDLSSRCDIPFEIFEDEDNTIPYAKLSELMELTARELKKPDFGIYLGTCQKVDILGPISVAVQTAKTVGEAMKCAARFVHIQSPAVHYHLEENHSGYVRAVMSINLPDLAQREMPQAMGLTAAVGQEIWRQLAGERFELLKLELPHEPLCPIPMYEAYFHGDIEFNSESVVWHVPREVYDAPLPLRSERLHEFASSYLVEQFPAQAKQLSVQVEKELRKLMETGNCTRDTIAEVLNLHPKTMQRRLAQEDCNFESIRDRVRRERATYYLCNTNLPFGQIAELIGYSDQAALSRSCQRWFSRSPREIRGENKSLTQTRAYHKRSPEFSS